MGKTLYMIRDAYYGDRNPHVISEAVERETEKLYLFGKYGHFGKQLNKAEAEQTGIRENAAEAWDEYVFKKQEEISGKQQALAEAERQLAFAQAQVTAQ